MAESDTAVDTAEESVTDHSVQEPQQSIEDLVTETTTYEKELSASIKHHSERPSHVPRQSDEGQHLSTVANVLEDIRNWVNDVDDEEWELAKFRLNTTIVAQRTETEEDDSENGSTSE